jgi:hypothetical protein
MVMPPRAQALWRRTAVGIAPFGFPTDQPGNCSGQPLGRPPGLDEQPTTGLSALHPPAEMATPADEVLGAQSQLHLLR